MVQSIIPILTKAGHYILKFGKLVGKGSLKVAKGAYTAGKYAGKSIDKLGSIAAKATGKQIFKTAVPIIAKTGVAIVAEKGQKKAVTKAKSVNKEFGQIVHIITEPIVTAFQIGII